MNYVFYAAVDRAGPVYTAPLGRGLFSGMRRRAVALHVAVLPGWRNRLLDVRSVRRCICGEGRSQPPRAVPAVPVGPLRTGRPWVCESRSTANGGTSGSTSELCKFAARMQRWSFVGAAHRSCVRVPPRSTRRCRTRPHTGRQGAASSSRRHRRSGSVGAESELVCSEPLTGLPNAQSVHAI